MKKPTKPVVIGFAVLAVCAMAFGGTDKDGTAQNSSTSDTSASTSVVSVIDEKAASSASTSVDNSAAATASTSASSALDDISEPPADREAEPEANAANDVAPVEKPNEEESITSEEPVAEESEAPGADAPVKNNDAEITVYVTNTGKKYHRGNCSSLKKSKIEISLEDAKRNYEPCEKCNPPS